MVLKQGFNVYLLPYIMIPHLYFPAFIVWAKKEMEIFLKIFKRHVFDSKSTFATIAECVSIATKHCEEVRMGINFY